MYNQPQHLINNVGEKEKLRDISSILCSFNPSRPVYGHCTLSCEGRTTSVSSSTVSAGPREMSVTQSVFGKNGLNLWMTSTQQLSVYGIPWGELKTQTIFRNSLPRIDCLMLPVFFFFFFSFYPRNNWE